MKQKQKPSAPGAKVPATFDTVRGIARALPGAEEGTSYGTPAFKVGGKLFVRQHQDGESLVVKMEPDERAMRLKSDPRTFHITDHYVNYPWVLVRLSVVDRDELQALLFDAWRLAGGERRVSSKAPNQGRRTAKKATPPKRAGRSGGRPRGKR
jgi:hypothetical protein